MSVQGLSKGEGQETISSAQEEAMQSETLIEVLKHLEENALYQTQHLKKQLRLTRACALICVAALLLTAFTTLSVAPRVSTVLNDMQTITSQLAKVDLEKTITDLDKLVVTSQSGIEDAVERINDIDIESLNESIKNLNAAVSPFAKLFGKKD